MSLLLGAVSSLVLVVMINCDLRETFSVSLNPGLRESVWKTSNRKHGLPCASSSDSWSTLTLTCVLTDLTWSTFFVSTFSDGNSKLTWQSDCAMWLLCLEVVRGRLSLGLGSVALLLLFLFFVMIWPINTFLVSVLRPYQWCWRSLYTSMF